MIGSRRDVLHRFMKGRTTLSSADVIFIGGQPWRQVFKGISCGKIDRSARKLGSACQMRLQRLSLRAGVTAARGESTEIFFPSSHNSALYCPG